MMCPRCDFIVSKKDNYCPYCGEPLKAIIIEKENENNYINYEYSSEDIEKNKLIAGLSYFSFLFILTFIISPNSKFAKFHANQGIILCIARAICSIIVGVLELVPEYQVIAEYIVDGVFLLLSIYGLISALKGKANRLPLIGKYKILK